MPTCIALLRGINVGGKNVLPMKELVRDLESLGLANVRTYIQSGNAVFERAGRVPASLGDRIATTIESRHGFRPHVQVLGAGELQEAIESNPFPEAEGDPKTLHLFFMESAPSSPDMDAIAAAASASERFRLIGQVFYLHAPDGIGRSKLAGKVEGLLGVAGTGRNWRTVMKLRDIALPT